jgi:hypothetical protein
MNFFKLIKNLFTGKKESQELKKEVLVTNSNGQPLFCPPSLPVDKKILKDNEGNNLVCCLCNNLDNETNKENPIYEGQKKTYDGKVWHIKCFRYFQKHAGEFIK